jgi:hypothetical protein
LTRPAAVDKLQGFLILDSALATAIIVNRVTLPVFTTLRAAARPKPGIRSHNGAEGRRYLELQCSGVQL